MVISEYKIIVNFIPAKLRVAIYNFSFHIGIHKILVYFINIGFIESNTI